MSNRSKYIFFPLIIVALLNMAFVLSCVEDDEQLDTEIFAEEELIESDVIVNESSSAEVDSTRASWGVYAGGYTGGGYLYDTDDSGYARVGFSWNGINAHGETMGGFFQDRDQTSWAYVAYGESGIRAFGDTAGGFFFDKDGTTYTYAAYDYYGIYTNGSVRGSGPYINDSDERLKKDVRTIDKALDKVQKLRGVKFSWKDDNIQSGRQLGFIAQEAEKVIPEAVVKPGNTDDYYGMTYGSINALLTEAIKELKSEKDKELANKDEEIAELRADQARLQASIDKLRNAIASR